MPQTTLSAQGIRTKPQAEKDRLLALNDKHIAECDLLAAEDNPTQHELSYQKKVAEAQKNSLSDLQKSFRSLLREHRQLQDETTSILKDAAKLDAYVNYSEATAALRLQVKAAREEYEALKPLQSISIPNLGMTAAPDLAWMPTQTQLRELLALPAGQEVVTPDLVIRYLKDAKKEARYVEAEKQKAEALVTQKEVIIEQYKESLEEKDAEIEELQEQLHAKLTDERERAANYDVASSIVEELHGRLADAERKVMVLAGERKRADGLQELKKELEGKVNMLNKQVDHNKEQMVALKLRCAESPNRAEVDRLQLDVTRLKKELADAHLELEGVKTERDSAIVRHQSSINALIDEERAQADDLALQKQRLEAAIRRRDSARKRQESALDQLEQKKLLSKANHDREEAELTVASTELEAVQADVDRARNQVSYAEEKSKDIGSRLEELVGVSARCLELEQRYDQRDEEIGQLRLALETRDQEWLHSMAYTVEDALWGLRLGIDQLAPVLQALNLDMRLFTDGAGRPIPQPQDVVHIDVINTFSDNPYTANDIAQLSAMIPRVVYLEPNKNDDVLDDFLYIQTVVLKSRTSIQDFVPLLYTYLVRGLTEVYGKNKQGLQVLLCLNAMVHLYYLGVAVPQPTDALLQAYEGFAEEHGILRVMVSRLYQAADSRFGNIISKLSKPSQNIATCAPSAQTALIPWLYRKWSEPGRESWLEPLDMAAGLEPNGSKTLILIRNKVSSVWFPDELVFVEDQQRGVKLFRGRYRHRGRRNTDRQIRIDIKLEGTEGSYSMLGDAYRYVLAHHESEINRLLDLDVEALMVRWKRQGRIGVRG